MRKLLLLLSAVLIISACSASAGSEVNSAVVGNGGDALVCYDSGRKIVSIEMLDSYEARVLTIPSLSVSMGPSELSWQEKVELVLKRFESIDAQRAVKYRERVKVFAIDPISGRAPEADYLPGIQLQDTDDSAHILIPRGCAIEQIAVQIHEELPGRKTFTINKDLWDLLDNNNKAALVLHEIIYEELLMLGATNSFRARYANGMLQGENLSQMKPGKYLEFLKLVMPGHLPEFFYAYGMKFSFVEGPYLYQQFFENGDLKVGYLMNPVPYEFHGAAVVMNGEIEFTEQGNVTKANIRSIELAVGEKTFLADQFWRVRDSQVGGQRGYRLAEDYKFRSEACNDYGVELPNRSELIFSEEGALVSANLSFYTYRKPVRLCAQHHIVPFKDNTEVLFYPDTGVRSGKLAEAFRFDFAENSNAWLRDQIEFHKNGAVKKGILSRDDELVTRTGKIWVQYSRAVNFDQEGYYLP